MQETIHIRLPLGNTHNNNLSARLMQLKDSNLSKQEYINNLLEQLDNSFYEEDKIMIVDFMLQYTDDEVVEHVKDEIRRTRKSDYKRQLYCTLAKHKVEIGVEIVREETERVKKSVEREVLCFLHGYNNNEFQSLASISNSTDMLRVSHMLKCLKRKARRLEEVKNLCRNIQGNIDNLVRGDEALISDMSEEQVRKEIMRRVKYLIGK